MRRNHLPAVVATSAAALFAVLAEPGSSERLASEIAFPIGILGASIYWSSIMLLAGADRGGPSSLYRRLVGDLIRYSTRTSAVAMAVLLVAGLHLVLSGAGAPPLLVHAVASLMIGGGILFAGRLLVIVGTFPPILDARAAPDPKPGSAPSVPRPRPQESAFEDIP